MQRLCCGFACYGLFHACLCCIAERIGKSTFAGECKHRRRMWEDCANVANLDVSHQTVPCPKFFACLVDQKLRSPCFQLLGIKCNGVAGLCYGDSDLCSLVSCL